MLWRKAIPAKKRMKEIEEGLKREFSSSTEEIQLIISNKETYQLK